MFKKLIKLSITNLVVLSLLVASICIFAIMPTAAQEATSSSVDQEEVKEKIKERLEEVVDSDFSEVKEEISKAKVYARIGRVKSIKDEIVSLELKDGQSQDVAVATDAAILNAIPGKEKKNLAIEDIKKEDYLITMGFIDESNKVFLAKRVVITQPPEAMPERTFVLGKVAEIDANKVTIQINGDKEIITIDSKKTKLKIHKVEKPVVEDINIEDRIAAIYTKKGGKISVVGAVLVIPGKNSPESEENEAKE